MKNREWSPQELKHKAERYCAAAERCESEVRMKLRQWNCDAKTIGEIVDFLHSADFINPDRYCRAFVHDKLAFQGWGRIKIEYMLRSKKLPASSIKSALDSIEETEYFEHLSRLARTKSYNALLLRGFSPDDLSRIS